MGESPHPPHNTKPWPVLYCATTIVLHYLSPGNWHQHMANTDVNAEANCYFTVLHLHNFAYAKYFFIISKNLIAKIGWPGHLFLLFNTIYIFITRLIVLLNQWFSYHSLTYIFFLSIWSNSPPSLKEVIHRNSYCLK